MMVGNFAFLSNCTLVGRTSDSMTIYHLLDFFAPIFSFMYCGVLSLLYVLFMPPKGTLGGI